MRVPPDRLQPMRGFTASVLLLAALVLALAPGTGLAELSQLGLNEREVPERYSLCAPVVRFLGGGGGTPEQQLRF